MTTQESVGTWDAAIARMNESGDAEGVQLLEQLDALICAALDRKSLAPDDAAKLDAAVALLRTAGDAIIEFWSSGKPQKNRKRSKIIISQGGPPM